ncbi:hypothetical protein FKM82_025496 [Ascaphus truei]
MCRDIRLNITLSFSPSEQRWKSRNRSTATWKVRRSFHMEKSLSRPTQAPPNISKSR